MDELVSIIMPSYNTGRFISETIESVLAQSYSKWELIIVDDCSIDNTDDVVNPYLDDTRIHYIKNDTNSGAAVSRNRALREAKGKWIAFLDSDDLWESDKLKKQVAFMEQNNYKFTCTDYRICLNGEWMPYINTAPNIITKRKLYNYCYFSTITAMYDREYVGLVQIADLKKNNDYAMWFEIIEKSPCYRLPECLSYYIKHDDSISGGSKWKLIKHHYILYRKGLKRGMLISAILTVNNLFFGIIKKIKYKESIK